MAGKVSVAIRHIDARARVETLVAATEKPAHRTEQEETR